MKKIMAFILLFVSSISVAKVFNNLKEIKNYLKEEKHHSERDPYVIEMQKAISDFKKAGIAGASVVGASAIFVFLVKVLEVHKYSFMQQHVGPLPVVTWAFWAVGACDIAGILYAGYKGIHGSKHLILAQYKKSLKNRDVKFS